MVVDKITVDQTIAIETAKGNIIPFRLMLNQQGNTLLRYDDTSLMQYNIDSPRIYKLENNQSFSLTSKSCQLSKFVIEGIKFKVGEIINNASILEIIPGIKKISQIRLHSKGVLIFLKGADVTDIKALLS